MRILLDNCTPAKLRQSLGNHLVRTAHEEGWAQHSNGKLLNAAETAGFDILITGDQNMIYQQNMRNRRIALIILSTNTWPIIRSHSQLLLNALNAVTPGSIQRVNYPRPPRPLRPYP